jgi:TonB family protein
MTARQREFAVARMPGLEITARRPVRIWIFAAIGAVAIHSGAVALALATLQHEDDPDELGANAIEVGYERLAPRAEPVDLPAGPDADASAAAPTAAEQKAIVKDTALPKAAPTETEDPDRIVSLKDKKPIEKEREVATAATQASAGAIAVEAAAVPTSEDANPSVKSAAPALGVADSARRLRTTWQKELAAHLNRHKRYPSDRSNQGAEIVVGFALDRTGHVMSASVVKSSGDASFDAAALAMIRRADPVPPPPPLVADEGLAFTVPVYFRRQQSHLMSGR